MLLRVLEGCCLNSLGMRVQNLDKTVRLYVWLRESERERAREKAAFGTGNLREAASFALFC